MNSKVYITFHKNGSIIVNDNENGTIPLNNSFPLLTSRVLSCLYMWKAKDHDFMDENLYYRLLAEKSQSKAKELTYRAFALSAYWKHNIWYCLKDGIDTVFFIFLKNNYFTLK